jgi:hypothetical protein
MSDVLTQQRRKAQNLDDAVEAIRAAKPDTGRLDETLDEPFISDEDKLTAIVAELAEMLARQERTAIHTAEHVAGDLTKRVEKLEKAEPGKAGAKPDKAQQPKSSRKK